MGWCSGGSLMSDVIKVIKEEVFRFEDRQRVYAKLIPLWEDHDCDVLAECLHEDSAYDEAWRKLHPLEEGD
jgi:hypothetical protein